MEISTGLEDVIFGRGEGGGVVSDKDQLFKIFSLPQPLCSGSIEE